MRLLSTTFVGATALVWGLLVGCSGDPKTSPPPGTISTPPCETGSIVGTRVTGTFVDTHCTESGPVGAPRSGAVLTVLVSKPGGGLCEVSTTVDAQGRFSFSAVPGGPFALRGASERPLVTSERVLELGTNRFGRPDVAPIRTSPTYLNFRANGLLPVTVNTTLLFLSVGAGIQAFPGFDSPPLVGATSLDGVSVDAAKFVRPRLVDGSKGDRAYLVQVEPRVDSNSTGIAAVFEPDPFTQDDGKVTSLAGTFRQPAGRVVTLGWDGPAFESVRGPNELPPGVSTSIVSVVAAPSDGSDCILPIFVANAFFKTSASLTSVTLTVANPYPSQWPVLVMASPGFGLVSLVPLDSLTGPLGPVVSAPRDLRVNGMSADADVSGVGTTPTLSFSTPAIGKADAYVIDVVETGLPIEGGVDLVAQIVTSDISITLPAGVLEMGAAYAFHVRARAGGRAAAPYLWWRATGYGEATASTHLVRP